MDWNDDGIGDFPGLAQRIDYLADLGVTCLWLMPFYPTPDRDDGYDITDFYGVDPRLGDVGDFVEVVRTARDRGIRVIVDLVVNHTSDKHPWFQASRSSTDLPYRDFYVWRADEPPDTKEEVVVPRPGEQHLGVRREDRRVVPAPLLPDPARPQHRQPAGPRRDRQGRWGSGWSSGSPASGWTPCRSCSRPTGVDRAELRPRSTTRTSTCASCGRSSAGVPATASCWARSTCRTRTRRRSSAASDGDELTMQFDFIGMQNLYLAMARQDAGPLAQALRQRPADLARTSQWATFVRNHDELTLDKLSDDERQEVFDAFGPRPGHAALRPRPAPAAAADARRRPAPDPDGLQPAVLPARHARCCSTARRSGWARTSPSTAGWPCARRCSGTPGATAASPTPPRRRLASGDGRARSGPSTSTSPTSAATPTRCCLRRRCWSGATASRRSSAGRDFSVLDQPHRHVLAHACTWDDRRIVAVHNLGPESCTRAADPRRLRQQPPPGRPAAGRRRHQIDDRGRAEVALEGYGYRWLRLMSRDSRRMA